MKGMIQLDLSKILSKEDTNEISIWSQLDNITDKLVKTKSLDSNSLNEFLSKQFGFKFNTQITSYPANHGFVGMSIYPTFILDDKAIMNLNVDNFSKMYSNSDDWTIEIDTRLLSNKLSLTSREISAILLHEIGHLKHNTSKLNKILAEVSYTINRLGFTNKQRYLMKDIRYKRLFLYPIFNSIRMDIKSAKSFKNEKNADSYAVSVGYGADLLSGMNKIRTQSDLLVDTAYVKSVMDLIEKREYNIARMIKANHDNTNSPWLLKHSKMLNDILPTEQINYNKESVFKDILIYNENVYNSVLDEYIQEGSLFKKKLKPIDVTEINYIRIQQDNIKSVNDKLMMSVYIQSKIDTIDYYIAILNSPISNKYQIPHSINELESMKSKLLEYEENIINKKIQQPGEFKLDINYPDEYAG